MAKYVIQLNFKEKYFIADLIGTGTFAKVLTTIYRFIQQSISHQKLNSLLKLCLRLIKMDFRQNILSNNKSGY